jgi:hypothetical protein
LKGFFCEWAEGTNAGASFIIIVGCIVKACYALKNDSNCEDALPQGCQMVYFRTKNPSLGKFWRALELKMLLHLMTIWNILWPFGVIYGRLV